VISKKDSPPGAEAFDRRILEKTRISDKAGEKFRSLTPVLPHATAV
jgi:hypothetical protein